MSAKHTPGPWRSEGYRIERPDGTSLVIVGGNGDERAIADRVLIAAAPEMLATLEDVAEWLDRGEVDGVGFDDASVLSCVRAAIKAAGGDA